MTMIYCAYGIEPHDEAATILAVNNDAGEGKHQHGGEGLQNGKSAQRHFRVRGFEDVPGDRGRVHPAAQHGDHVGGEDEAQRALAEDGSHTFTLADVREREARGLLDR